MKKIVCLYGGPGSGKSTVAAGLYASLKLKGVNCELNREYVKGWAWEGRDVLDGDQTYFFAKQSRNERLLVRAGVSAVICDSPLLLCHFYGLKYCWLERSYNTSLALLQHHHAFCRANGYTVEHFFVKRAEDKLYNEEGRFQTKEEALAFDKEIQTMLDDLGVRYTKVNNAAEVEEGLNASLRVSL